MVRGAVIVVRVVTSRVAVAKILTLDLVGGFGEHGNVAIAAVDVSTRVGGGKRGKRVRRRDVGRAQGRGGSGTNRLGGGRRSHEALRVHVVRQTVVDGVLLVKLLLLALVTTARVGVVVDSRVPRQLIGARKLFGAAGELAGVRLLASVSANVSCLVLEAVESLVAERALVWARQLGGVGAIGSLGGRERPVGLDDANGSGSHVSVTSMEVAAWINTKRLLLWLVVK